MFESRCEDPNLVPVPKGVCHPCHSLLRNGDEGGSRCVVGVIIDECRKRLPRLKIEVLAH